MCASANKYYLAVDMHQPEGLDIIKKLAASSDIVMENFKAGTFDKWGIGYRQMREIKPDIVYLSMQGFGNCSNTGACEAQCPKQIKLFNIARLNREYYKAF